MTLLHAIRSPEDVAIEIAALVRTAYRNSGREPRGGRYLRQAREGRHCACAVGVVHLVHARGAETRDQTWHRLTGSTPHQQRDFELGFDSAFKPPSLYQDFAPQQPLWWQIGRHVGLTVRPRLVLHMENVQ